MGVDLRGFRRFVEDKSRSLHKKHKHEEEPENLLDGMWRELGIDPNSIPQFIESGPIHLEDEGIWYNQAVWEVLKPIELSDTHVRIKFHKSLSPNLNQHAYRKREDGKMVPYKGDPSGRKHIITIKKLAEMLGKPWQSVAAGGGAGGAGGMMM